MAFIYTNGFDVIEQIVALPQWGEEICLTGKFTFGTLLNKKKINATPCGGKLAPPFPQSDPKDVGPGPMYCSHGHIVPCTVLKGHQWVVWIPKRSFSREVEFFYPSTYKSGCEVAECGFEGLS